VFFRVLYVKLCFMFVSYIKRGGERFLYSVLEGVEKTTEKDTQVPTLSSGIDKVSRNCGDSVCI